MRREGFWQKARHLLRDESATSDVEYILLTAMVVLPLFAVPPLIISANADFYHRMEPWIDLPFP